jgi:hypothetical protein
MQYQTSLNTRNPIYKDRNGKYYFWDENWMNSFGPYQTKEKAEKELDKYVRYLNGEL